MNIKKIIVAAVAAVSLALGASAATDLVWSGNGDSTNWNDPANWDGTHTPGSGYVLVFNDGATTVNNMGNVTVSGIRTDAGATKDLTIGGTGTLTIDSGVIKNQASKNIYFDCPVATSSMSWNNGMVLGPAPASGTYSDYGVYFRGGFSSSNTLVLYGRGELHFEGTPFSLTSMTASEGRNRIYLSVPGNTIASTGAFRIYWPQYIYFTVKDALVASVSLGNTGASGEATVDLGGCDQTKFRSFKAVAKTANIATLITSTDKANIVLEGDSQLDGEALQMRMTGKAGLVWNPSSSKTVTFGAYTQTTTGELGVLNGTMALASGATFTSLEKLTVGKDGTFRADAGGGANFHADELQVTAGSTLNLASGVTLTFGTAKLVDDAGEFIKYLDINDYSSPTEGVTITGGGKISVQSKPMVHTTARWDAGGGSATGLTTASNWDGDKTPDLTSGGLTATFDAGSVATVDTTAMFEGIAVTANTADFTFAKSGDNAVSVLANGITVAAGSSARSVSFDAPLATRQEQTWTVSGAQDTLAVIGGLTGSAPVSFAGYGKLTLGGQIDYTGKLTFMPTSKSTIQLEDADYAGSFHFGNPTATSRIGSTLISTGDCILRGHVNFRDAMTIANNGRLVFAGGILPQFDLMIEGGGTYVVTNTPITHSAIKNWFSDQGNLTELWTVGNIANFIHYNGSRLVCHVPGALRSDCNLRLGVEAFNSDHRGWLTIEGDQNPKNFITYPSLHGSGAQEVYSSTGSKLTVSPSLEDTDCYAAFLGGASYDQDGKSAPSGVTPVMTFYKTSSSTGTVSVASGKIVFAAPTTKTFTCAIEKKDVNVNLEGGSWENASRVTIGNKGTIELTHGKTFGKQTVVELQQGGKLQLDAGVVEKVAELWLGGTKVPAGIYGSTASGAQTKDDTYFSGAGLLRVGKVGLVLVVE